MEVIPVLHIAICDDEESEIKYLKRAVEDWAKKEDILINIETYASAESFLFQYEECKNYQILLLDVEMSGMSGINLAKKIRQNRDNVEIIFITSHFEFIGEGYEVEALHYLVNPVKASKMEEVLSQAISKIAAGVPSRKKGLENSIYKDLDEEGVEISGGEAQKIALARALYKNAPFIILDEPTAALDPIAEYEVYSKFNEIVQDKTAIYISHRLSSCRFCDVIAVFDGGQIVQRGVHDRLLQDTHGKYYELWNAQAQYYT